MRTLINIPIEPIESRYSIQWDKWFLEYFSERFNLTTVYGPGMSKKIEHGSFLDVCNTNIYKTSQLGKILNILKTYDDKEPLILFFHDLWFPGLEAIAYVRDGMGFKNLKICGCLHAGSYDYFDFLNKSGMTPWARHMEIGWFNVIVDKIFVATEFHKDMLLSSFRVTNPDKIAVTGFPIFHTDYLEYYTTTKEKIVVFPHRLDSEKNPNLFDNLITIFKGSDWRFIKTKEFCYTTVEYRKLLGKAFISVSFAEQETWGIAMQESVLCGCIPLVPNRLSYSEMYENKYLYDGSLTDLISKMTSYMNVFGKENCTPDSQFLSLLQAGFVAIPNMIRHINSL